MENKINPVKLFIRESWLLILAALCFGLLLSGANYALQPKIEANKIASKNQALKELLQQANSFTAVIDEEDIQGIAHKITRQ